jgi:hypothetical protein
MSREAAENLVLDDIEREAMSIVFSEFEGNKFDWESMTFVKASE